MTQVTASETPLVTFALFAYNQEEYIREAVEGAFSQNYEPLEIILSDDCSTDKTFEIMQEMAASYRGPHKIIIRRNTENNGLGVHVNTVLSEARGDIVMMAAGDDISLPGRCAISVDILKRNPSAAEVLLSMEEIDTDGNLTGTSKATGTAERLQTLSDLLKWRHRTSGASRAFRLNGFRIFGPLSNECPTEDTPFLLRSLILGGSVLSNEVGVRYRKHDKNLSGTASMRKMNVGAIHAQYSSDISRAESVGMLNAVMSAKLHSWIQDDNNIRSLRLKLKTGERLRLRDLIAVAGMPAFRGRDVVKSLKLTLFGSSNR